MDNNNNNSNIKSIRIFSLVFSLVANNNESFGTTTYMSVSSRNTKHECTMLFKLHYSTERVCIFQSKSATIREQVSNNIA